MKPAEQRQLLSACVKAVHMLSVPAIVFASGANPANGGVDKATGATLPLLDDEATEVLDNGESVTVGFLFSFFLSFLFFSFSLRTGSEGG